MADSTLSDRIERDGSKPRWLRCFTSALYIAAAMAIGVGWRAIVRAWDPELVGDTRIHSGLAHDALFALASLIISLGFRRVISGGHWFRAVAIGCTLPFAGAVCVVCLYGIVAAVGTGTWDLLAMCGACVLMSTFALNFALEHVYATVPMGVACTLLLRSIDRWEPSKRSTRDCARE